MWHSRISAELEIAGTAGYMLGTAGYMVSCGVDGTAGYMLGTAGYMVVAHVILVSPQSQLDLDFDLGLLWV